MNIQVFAKEVMNEILKNLPNAEIEEIEVTKSNDTALYGLYILENNDCQAPVFYLNEDYEKYCDSQITVKEVAEKICETHQIVMSDPPEIDSISEELDWEELKSKLGYRLIGVENNKQYLQDKPHKVVADGLALICDILIIPYGRATVTKDVLESINVSQEELFDATMKSSMMLEPATLTPLNEGMVNAISGGIKISDFNFISANKLPAVPYVLTNKDKWFGASALFYDNIMLDIREKIREDYYVIPSSLHEVIIFPGSWVDGNMKCSYLEKMLKTVLKTVNEEYVSPEEILSDKIYHYSAGTINTIGI